MIGDTLCDGGWLMVREGGGSCGFASGTRRGRVGPAAFDLGATDLIGLSRFVVAAEGTELASVGWILFLLLLFATSTLTRSPPLLTVCPKPVVCDCRDVDCGCERDGEGGGVIREVDGDWVGTSCE